jgi:integrase
MATADSILGALLATPLSALDGDAILDYLHDRETESRTKTGTRYKRTSILREYRNLHAAIRKFRPDLDWPNMRGKRGWSEGQQIPREPMTAEQKTRLLVALEEPYRTVAQLGMWLNPRRASFAKMERAHCHLDDPNGAWLLLPETKAHKQEIVPLEPPAIALFRAQLARHPGNKWVFPSPWKNGQTPISGGQFFVRVKRALRTIGRPDLNFHSLRHQFASDLLQQGYSLEKIAKAGRWDRVVKIYAHQADADTRAMQRALAHPASPRRRKLGGIV